MIELNQILYTMVLACFAYLGVIFLVDVVLLAVSALENAQRIRQRRGESLDAFFASEYVMPVSVVVPVYNEEDVIVPVVHSLLRLEYAQHEIIVVNDGSSDDTSERARSHGDRVTVIDQPNGGPPAAYNRGFDTAVSDYVAMCPAASFVLRYSLKTRFMSTVPTLSSASATRAIANEQKRDAKNNGRVTRRKNLIMKSRSAVIHAFLWLQHRDGFA